MWPAYFIFKETILKAAESVSACKHAIEKGSLMRARERQTEGEHAQQECLSHQSGGKLWLNLQGSLKRKLQLKASELPTADLGVGFAVSVAMVASQGLPQ